MARLSRHLLAAALAAPAARSLRAAVPELPRASPAADLSARAGLAAANGTNSTQLTDPTDKDLQRYPLGDLHQIIGPDFDMRPIMTNAMHGYHDSFTSGHWNYWQKMISDRLYTTLSKEQKSPLRTLVVTYIPDTEASMDLWRQNIQKLRANKAGDTFGFVFFHYDRSNTNFVFQPWYLDPTITKVLAEGCKASFWQRLDGYMVAEYDYVWLSDGDLALDSFSWDLYRIVLAKFRPLVSQPAVIPKCAYCRSSDFSSLRGRAHFQDGDFEIMRGDPHSEIMTPVLDTRVWPSFKKRMEGASLGTSWYLDTWWDLLAHLDFKHCGGPGILVLNASPVTHLDTKTMDHTPSRCQRSPGYSSRNNRAISQEERELMTKVLCARAAPKVFWLNSMNGLYSAAKAARPERFRGWTMPQLMSA